MGLLLQAVDVVGPHRWRWLLVDERSGKALADHPVNLDTAILTAVLDHLPTSPGLDP